MAVPALLVVLAATIHKAGADGTQVSTGAVSMSVWVPCANGGAGEYVGLEGLLRAVTHTVRPGDDGFILRSQFRPVDVSGSGLTTGTTYYGVGVTSLTVTDVGPTSSSTYLNNFRLVARSSVPTLAVHEVVHVTITEAGGVTATVGSLSIDCA